MTGETMEKSGGLRSGGEGEPRCVATLGLSPAHTDFSLLLWPSRPRIGPSLSVTKQDEKGVGG